MGLNTFDQALAGIEASMQAAMPHRVVQRSLVIDPMNHDPAALAKGVICLVAGGGGQFANYRGREGQLGHASLGVVAFVKVPEDSEPVAVESAELAVLADVLFGRLTHRMISAVMGFGGGVMIAVVATELIGDRVSAGMGPIAIFALLAGAAIFSGTNWF